MVSMKGPFAHTTFRMLRPTDILRAEHGLARTGLRVLVAIARRVHTGERFPTNDVATLLRFLREFVLAVHMRKEAEVVWPGVAMRADEATAAEIGNLFRLHDEVAELVHALVLFWEPVDDLTPAERAGFCDSVNALVLRLHRMQQIEEEVLFAACDRAVPADDQLDWPALFTTFERDRAGAGAWSRRLAPLVRTWTA